MLSKKSNNTSVLCCSGDTSSYYKNGDVFINLLKNETIFACKCKDNKMIKKYIIKIFYFVTKYIKHNFKKESLDLMNKLYIQEETIGSSIINPKTIIIKPGFTLKEIKKLHNLVDNKRIFKYVIKKDFRKIMGVLWECSRNTDLIYNMIEQIPKLKNKLTQNFKILFCKQNFEYENFKLLFLNNNSKNIILDLIMSFSENVSLSSKNLFNAPYIRTPHNTINKYYYSINPVKLFDNADINECLEILKESYKEMYIGDSCYTVDNNSLFATLCNDNNKPYIAGPSRSCILLYIFVFLILGKLNINNYKLKNNMQSKFLLLGACIADYIPYSHTMIEILLIYMQELKTELESLKFNINSIWGDNYIKIIKKLFKKVDIIIS